MTKQDKQTSSDRGAFGEFEGYEAERLNSKKLDVKIGDRVTGVFQGTGILQVNPSREDLESGKAKPGEKKDMPIVRFLEPKTKEPCHINGDAGLMNTIQASGVDVGQLVGLHRKEKITLAGGKSVNDWDLYRLTAVRS